MWEVRVTPAGDFDNHPLPHKHIEVEPLSAAMGAEVVGVRLPDLSDEGFEELKQALYRHKMIYLRGQHLTHAEHEAFGARLGPFAVDAYTQGVEGHREVHPIIKEADTRVASLFGGDTSWANCALAFRHLSKTYQDMLRPLRVHMSARNNYLTQSVLLDKPIEFSNEETREQGLKGRFHPLVRTHPETGEESHYICDTYTVGFEGMTTAEAKPIVDFLVAHCTQAAFTCRLRWEPGMVAMWDNRAAMHLGPNDYDGYRREMYRTTTAGTKPV